MPQFNIDVFCDVIRIQGIGNSYLRWTRRSACDPCRTCWPPRTWSDPRPGLEPGKSRTWRTRQCLNCARWCWIWKDQLKLPKSFFFKKMGQPRPLIVYFRSFQAKIITIFTTCEKMSIQYTVLGFELTTFWTRVSSHNH